MKKVLYGVCGIGHGHSYRQLPVIERLAETCRMVVFAYGKSLEFYAKRFAGHPNVEVVEVAVPFYVGGPQGIDLEATWRDARNVGKDFAGVNDAAKKRMAEVLGIPDLVVSDYEPICTEVAYEHGAPLVTIDQQSKYLCGDFPAEVEGLNAVGEVARLRMLFPKAAARIACSFFAVSKKAVVEEVEIVAPILRPEIAGMRREVADVPEVLVYLSAQEGLKQSLAEIVAECGKVANVKFHLVGAKEKLEEVPGNVVVYGHGGGDFDRLLARVVGIISTAGHSLLSEAMHLGIPVLALPLPIYEQEVGARVIGENGFGMLRRELKTEGIREFVMRANEFTANIRNDARALVRGDGLEVVMAKLDHFLKSGL